MHCRTRCGPKLIETRDSVFKAILWVFKDSEIHNDNIARFENQTIKNESIAKKDKTTDNELIKSQSKGRREGLSEIGRKLKQNYKTPYFTAVSIIVVVVFLFTSFLALIINLPLKRFFRKLRKTKLFHHSFVTTASLCCYVRPQSMQEFYF